MGFLRPLLLLGHRPTAVHRPSSLSTIDLSHFSDAVLRARLSELSRNESAKARRISMDAWIEQRMCLQSGQGLIRCELGSRGEIQRRRRKEQLQTVEGGMEQHLQAQLPVADCPAFESLRRRPHCIFAKRMTPLTVAHRRQQRHTRQELGRARTGPEAEAERCERRTRTRQRRRMEAAKRAKCNR